MLRHNVTEEIDMLKYRPGQVRSAVMPGQPDLIYTFEMIAPVRLRAGIYWIGIKHLDEARLASFPGNQTYLFDSNGLSLGDGNGARFRLTEISRRKACYTAGI